MLNKIFRFELSNFINESYQTLIFHYSNKIYKKGFFEKNYKIWYMSKNATKAKKLMAKLITEYGLVRFGQFRNVFVSGRAI